MTLIFEDPAKVSGIGKINFPEEKDNADVGWMEAIASGFEKENSLSSAILNSQNKPTSITDEEMNDFISGKFNPLDEVKGTKYENPDDLKHVAKARSKRELDWITQSIDHENYNNEVLSRASGTKSVVSAITAGILDPVMAPTLAVPALRASTTTRVLYTSGVGAATASVSEGALHATQRKRTLSESAWNIGGGAIFGAMIGPFGPKLPENEVAKIASNLDEEMHGIPIFSPDSAGAMRVDDSLPEGYLSEIQDKVLKGEMTELDASKALRDKRLDYTKLKYEPVIKKFSWASPVLRVATSKSVKARSILENMIEDSFIRTKNEFGHTSGPSVETIVKMNEMVSNKQVHDIIEESYSKYIGSTSRVGQTIKSFKDKNILSFDEFANEIGKAQRLGDAHTVPEVEMAAKRLRSEIDNPIEDVLVKEKLIPTEEVDGGVKAAIPGGDKSYLPRIYDFEKIMHNRHGFKQAVIKGIRQRIKDPKTLAKFDDPVEMRMLNNQLDETITKITSSPLGYFDKSIVPETSFLKGRTLDIPSEAIQDFLVNDVRAVKSAYIKHMMPRIEMGKRFKSYDLIEDINEMHAEYDKFIETLEPGSSKVKQLQAERNRVERDILAMRDQLFHNYARPNDPTSAWSKAGRVIRTHNYITSLGGMTIASLPDVGNIIARIGLKPFARGLKNLALHPKEFNYSRAQAKRFGAGLDVVLHSRANAMAMFDDDYVGFTKFERGMQMTRDSFSKITGMAYWNAGWKQFAAVMYMDDIGRLIAKGDLSPNNVTKLAAAGIDNNMWNRIVKEWKKYGTKDMSINSPNTELWKDAEARQAIAAAVLKEVDTAVVTPGIGDLPLASRSDVGKLIFQFKSFTMAAQNRMFLAGMQRWPMDANQAMGFISMMALGSLTYGMKEFAAGGEPNTDWNTLLREAADKSGYFGYMTDINAITEKATRGAVGAQSILGGEPLSRYKSKSVVTDLLGPTAGKMGDVATAIGTLSAAIGGGEISEADIRAVRRLIPYQNLIYIRRALNKIEEAAADRYAD